MTETILASGTASWIPVPHTMTLAFGETLPPAHLTTAAFVFVLDSQSRMLLTHVNLPGRGWDVPGGHIDEGETAEVSAARELAEETGLVLSPAELSVVGRQTFVLDRHPPAWYSYPFPLSHIAYFASRVEDPPAPSASLTAECGPAEWCGPPEVARRCGTTSWFPLFEHLVA